MLTSDEIKQILQKRIEEKQKEVRPDLFNQIYVELIIAELETLHSILANIDDEERRRSIINKNK
jgi:hypothetical protein